MPKIFAAFAIDYKFIDGQLVIFELGNAFQSNTERTLHLYGKTQFEEVINQAAQFASQDQLNFYCDLQESMTPTLPS